MSNDPITCKKCGHKGPPEDFRKDSRSPTGRRPECHTCHNTINLARKKKATAEIAAISLEQERKRREQEEKAVINRNAILRLINAHRHEFDSYVNAEMIRHKGPEAGKAKAGAWLQLA